VLLLITLAVALYVTLTLPLAVIIGRGIKAGLGNHSLFDEPRFQRAEYDVSEAAELRV
jgi:hypothetical protein